ncbi:MAG: M23 family metallopeptidase [Longimicrobiales bacterium]
MSSEKGPFPLRVTPLRTSLFTLLLTLLVSGCGIPRWPAQGPLVSGFGLRTQGMFLGLHRGVDIQVPEGTEVRAMVRGRVRFAGTQRGYGRVVWLDHPGDVLTVYAHLSAVLVQAGQEVKGGQVIALSGQSGRATGPHLHFEVWRWGREVDPVPFLGGFPGR